MISLNSISSGNQIGSSDQKPDDGTKKPNIFGQALNTRELKQNKKEEYLRKKNSKKAVITLGASLTVLAVYSIFFFYGNVMAYIKAPGQIREGQTQIEEYENVVLPSLEKTRELHKAAYDKEFEEIITALDTVFPEGIDKLGIVKLFESFATEVDANFPPFEFTSISLSNPTQRDGYIVVPVSTSIHSSLAGFDKFLSLVEKSGTIYEGEGENRKLLDKMVRLMSISNISIQYRGIDDQTGKDGGVDFSVKLNVYSRPETEQNS